MTRPLRVDMGDGVYHVMTRGIDRNDIFRCDGDRMHWLGLMAEAQSRFRLRIFAYVLMDNHVHLIVQTPDANLSRAMQWLKVSYSMWFNARYGRKKVSVYTYVHISPFPVPPNHHNMYRCVH